MEKEPQPESIATVTIKPDYPPSEVYSSEPPPAYHRPQSSAVQVAKIVAVTVVLVSFVLGSFLLASAYVTANASCRQLEQELELLSEAADRFQQAAGPSQPEALVQDEPQAQKLQADNLQTQETKKTNEIINNNIDSNADSSSDSSDSSNDSNESDEDDRTPIHIKLPLQLDFDDLAGALIDKNQRSRMNCIVEKKRAEEVVDHRPKTVQLPFGLNLTTDPRYEHVSGERMAIFCQSGNIQRNALPQDDNNDDNDDDDDEEEETIMIQPVMIPIPQTHFPTHMAQQMQPIPIPQQQQQQPQPRPTFQQIHPMEAMRPPMPPMMASQQNHQLPPNPILHHIAQQIIAQKIMEAQRAREEQQQQQQEQAQQNNEISMPEQRRYPIPDGIIAQRVPIPEEVLTQLNRLPNRDVIVAVSEQEPEEVQQQQPQQQQQMHIVQQQRQDAQEMNGRQTYARGLPVHIPVHMIEQDQEPQAVPSEEPRPHYVQPRSVRSVDALLPKNQKRVKRCSCDCAC